MKQIETVPVIIGHWFKQRATIEIYFFSSLAALSVELSRSESEAQIKVNGKLTHREHKDVQRLARDRSLFSARVGDSVLY